MVCALAGWARATLVVCPLVAVIQWQSEIARFTAPGTVKVRECLWFLEDLLASQRVFPECVDGILCTQRVVPNVLADYLPMAIVGIAASSLG